MPQKGKAECHKKVKQNATKTGNCLVNRLKMCKFAAIYNLWNYEVF